jgi:hypothetical protein
LLTFIASFVPPTEHIFWLIFTGQNESNRLRASS